MNFHWRLQVDLRTNSFLNLLFKYSLYVLNRGETTISQDIIDDGYRSTALPGFLLAPSPQLQAGSDNSFDCSGFYTELYDANI
jgi:hypothetical protein